jgi:hypothetical protein
VKRPPAPARGEPAVFFAGDAYDPAAGAGLVAWQRPSGIALLRRAGADRALPGHSPALGGGTLAWLEGEQAVIADAASGAVRARLAVPGARVLGVSDQLLAWRAPDAAGRDVLWTRTLGAPPGPPQPLVQAPEAAELGRPAVRGTQVLFHAAGILGSQIVLADVATGAQLVLRETPAAQVTNPSTDGTLLLHVRATGRQQELRLGPMEARAADVVIAVHPSSGRRDSEHERGRKRHKHPYRSPLPPIASPGETQSLWSTALAPDGAYVTRIVARTGEARRADILRVTLPVAG